MLQRKNDWDVGDNRSSAELESDGSSHDFDRGGAKVPLSNREVNLPCAPFHSRSHSVLALLCPYAKLGEEVSRPLEVYLGDIWESTQHAVYVGINIYTAELAMFVSIYMCT